MNNTKLLLVSALLLSAVSQLNCSGCNGGGSNTPDASSPDGSNGPPIVDNAVESKPRPVVSLALRGRTEVTLGAGVPWLLFARVLHPAALQQSVTESFPVSGEGAFALELQNDAGAPVTAAFERVGTPIPGPTVIDATTELELSWRLSAAEAAKLSEGHYTLRLALDVSGVKVRSAPVEITLGANPDASEFAAQIAAADDAMARGDLPAAEAAVDAVLASDPEHVQALSRKAELRERAGDLQGAYDTFNDAINAAHKAEPGAPEGGPRHLYFRRAQLAEQLDGGGN